MEMSQAAGFLAPQAGLTMVSFFVFSLCCQTMKFSPIIHLCVVSGWKGRQSGFGGGRQEGGPLK